MDIELLLDAGGAELLEEPPGMDMDELLGTLPEELAGGVVCVVDGVVDGFVDGGAVADVLDGGGVLSPVTVISATICGWSAQ